MGQLFIYDNLDRLTTAQYGINDQNEIFTIDDLGNRSNVKVRDGSNVAYSVNNTNNRYNTVGGNSLTYDAAGNLIADKDGYTYHYDYENRIVKIRKSNDTVDVASYVYDALGRRIRKVDSIAGTTTLYYYGSGWQILCEYNAGSLQRWYAYGNYIDEPLIMSNSANASDAKFYIHDHLYSPAALTDSSGNVVERYEYDAYGKPHIMDSTYGERPASNFSNPYMFTGRNVDFLDNSNLKLQYNRNRYYDYYTGRWYTHDPLGITPNAQLLNVFKPILQHLNGMNLYGYIKSNPSSGKDPYGLVDLGTTTCDPSTGTPLININYNDCGKECVIEHEQTHAKQMEGCCSQLPRCITEYGRSYCMNLWESWMNDNRSDAECEAHRVGRACVNRMRIEKDCGNKCNKNTLCCRELKALRDSAEAQRQQACSSSRGYFTLCPFSLLPPLTPEPGDFPKY